MSPVSAKTFDVLPHLLTDLFPGINRWNAGRIGRKHLTGHLTCRLLPADFLYWKKYAFGVSESAAEV